MQNEQNALREQTEKKIKAVLARPIEVPAPVAGIGPQEMAALIDHTQLKAAATQEQIETLCRQAREYNFAAVCVNASYVALCHQLLEGTDVAVAAVAGFPLGATLPEVKAYEAQRCIAAGATEIDMVIHVGALLDRRYEVVYQDILGVVQACHARNATLKVIIEAALLTDEDKVAACFLSQKAGADYVKTSTGFGPWGAKVEDVALMRKTVGPEMGIKAAGGIRTYADATAMVGAGATRIGASAGIQLVESALEASAGSAAGATS
jgi:deoxyribose-phosphate aldolase